MALSDQEIELISQRIVADLTGRGGGGRGFENRGHRRRGGSRRAVHPARLHADEGACFTRRK